MVAHIGIRHETSVEEWASTWQLRPPQTVTVGGADASAPVAPPPPEPSSPVPVRTSVVLKAADCADTDVSDGVAAAERAKAHASGAPVAPGDDESVDGVR